MQAFTKDLFHKIVFTLIIKVPHFCLQRSRAAPSVALLLHNHSLFSFQGADKKVHAVRKRLLPPGIVYPLN